MYTDVQVILAVLCVRVSSRNWSFRRETSPSSERLVSPGRDQDSAQGPVFLQRDQIFSLVVRIPALRL